jgi:hypothetical protein
VFFNGVDIGCSGTTPCPPCPPAPPCPSSPCPIPPAPLPIIPSTVSFIATKNFRAGGGSVYGGFGFTLASDFYFLEDRAVMETGYYEVYNYLRDPDDTKYIGNLVYENVSESDEQFPSKPNILPFAVALLLGAFAFLRKKKVLSIF